MAETNVLGVVRCGLWRASRVCLGLDHESPRWSCPSPPSSEQLALGTVYALATRGGITPMSTLLLSGIALGALLAAMSSLLISLNIVELAGGPGSRVLAMDGWAR